MRLDTFVPILLLAMATNVRAGDADDLRRAVTFYASFDKEVRGDMGGGALKPQSRFNTSKTGVFQFKKGIDADLFRIAAAKGIHGGALEAVDVLPNNGRIFFPAKGNLAYRKEGWSGAVSVWCKTGPDKLLKTTFCDPVQITQKGALNGGIWFDFNGAKPRDLRHGAFPALAERQKPPADSDPQAPMVRVPKIGWQSNDWHHVVLTWKNFDTGKDDAVSSLYIDGKLIGRVQGRAIAMDWDIEQTGVYFAVNYIGLLDELGLFNRELTAEEVTLLHKQPGMLAALGKR